MGRQKSWDWVLVARWSDDFLFCLVTFVRAHRMMEMQLIQICLMLMLCIRWFHGSLSVHPFPFILWHFVLMDISMEIGMHSLSLSLAVTLYVSLCVSPQKLRVFNSEDLSTAIAVLCAMNRVSPRWRVKTHCERMLYSNKDWNENMLCLMNAVQTEIHWFWCFHLLCACHPYSDWNGPRIAVINFWKYRCPNWYVCSPSLSNDDHIRSHHGA